MAVTIDDGDEVNGKKARNSASSPCVKVKGKTIARAVSNGKMLDSGTLAKARVQRSARTLTTA